MRALASGDGVRDVGELVDGTPLAPRTPLGLALDSTGLLDTVAEERFDRFTTLARTIWDVPLATITLIDQDRAFFKSCAGMDLPDMPSDQTFCSRVVQLDDLVVVPDASLDPRFRDLPGVVGPPHIRFYAGQPVHDAHGTPLGTMCIYDVETREFGEKDRELLSQLAGCVEEEIRVSSDRDLATTVQRALLPRRVAPVLGYTFGATCVPTGLVAGDAFDHLSFPDGHYVLVADVMGKGTAAAILMASVRSAVRAEMRAFAADGGRGDLGAVLTRVREVVQEDLDAAAAFVTAFLGWADPLTGTMRFADAGHGLSAVVHTDGTTTPLPSTDLPLGVEVDGTWQERSVTLADGETFVSFSDGLLDVLGESDVFGTVARLVGATDSPGALVREVERLALDVPTRDDVTLLAVRRDGPE